MPENDPQAAVTGREYWNSPSARAWAEQHERQDRALAGLAEAALELAAPQPGERVLDIGCGSGTTLLALAARVGPHGSVLGVDIAQASVERARQRLAAAVGLAPAKSSAPMPRRTPSRPPVSTSPSRAWA